MLRERRTRWFLADRCVIIATYFIRVARMRVLWRVQICIWTRCVGLRLRDFDTPGKLVRFIVRGGAPSGSEKNGDGCS